MEKIIDSTLILDFETESKALKALQNNQTYCDRALEKGCSTVQFNVDGAPKWRIPAIFVTFAD